MPRKSLRPELNRIRAWVRQGRTDAWIAHQLEVTVQQIQTFKKEQSLEAGVDADPTDLSVDFDDEVDLRAVDEAQIAAELDAEAEARAAAEAEAAALAEAEAAARAAAGEDEEDAEEKPKRRRGRRGGRSSRRKKPVGPLEGTFDHGEEGYGLWLDPSVQDDPVYAEYWAGHRPVEVIIEEDQIIIRRVSSEPEAEADDSTADDAAVVEAVADAAEAVEAAEANAPVEDAADDTSEVEAESLSSDPDAEAIAAEIDDEE